MGGSMRGIRTTSRKAAIAAGLLFGLCVANAAHAGSGIGVIMNEAKIIKLARAADTVVIGNPEIADATVQDATTLILTGRGFGVTNLVVMDVNGDPFVDEQITVSRQAADSVRVYRRSDIQTLSCTPYCEGSYKNEAERISEMEIALP